MRPICIPERAKARSADCAPGPGVLVLRRGQRNYNFVFQLSTLILFMSLFETIYTTLDSI